LSTCSRRDADEGFQQDKESTNKMKAIKQVLYAVAMSVCLGGALAQAASVTGTVTNKTTGKPAAGDKVALVDVQAGMAEVAQATTDAHGRYTLNEPGSGPYLIRVTHQGAGYFIAAPQGGGPGDIPVYDVAAKVDGVSIEADVIELETDNGGLHVTERYFVHNTSSPPKTEWSPKTFLISLPAGATIVGTAAQRPTGLPTSVKLDPAGPKDQYAFNFPIQPDEGEKDTLFQLEYTLPYSDGKFTFHPKPSLPTQNVGVLLPKSMTFAAGAGSAFQQVQEDPGVQTFVARNLTPGAALEFTVSGTGSMPRGQQAAGQQGDSGGQASPASGQPGGGIGEPINTPDPLSKYKWWILGGLALVLAAAAAFLLRKPAGAVAAPGAAAAAPAAGVLPAYVPAATSAATKNAALMNALKEELFTLESEKLSGTVKPEEYAEAKAALETVLKRALKRNS
jgi:hypothetical protein